MIMFEVCLAGTIQRQISRKMDTIGLYVISREHGVLLSLLLFSSASSI
jgi:hypothetical protein